MKNKRLLLVEDSQDDLDLMFRVLRDIDVQAKIDAVKDGEEAVNYLFGNGDSLGCHIHNLPHLIMLDLKLPKLDGQDLLTRIRNSELTRYIPVVILTSSKENSDLQNCYCLGASGYIQKPLDFIQFTTMVRDTMAYWLDWNVTI